MGNPVNVGHNGNNFISMRQSASVQLNSKLEYVVWFND